MTFLNHWGQVVQICVGVIGTGNDMLAIQYQAIYLTSADLLFNRSWGIHFI